MTAIVALGLLGSLLGPGQSATTLTVVESERLTAGMPAQDDHLGSALALAGARLAVGAYDHDAPDTLSAGAVYVFERAGSAWTETALLMHAGPQPGDRLGASVALSCDTILAGADGSQVPNSGQGSAHVFVFDGSAWTEQAVLRADAPEAGDHFGCAVAIEGDTAVVGAWGDKNVTTPSKQPGAVYVFVRSGTSWTEQARLVSSDAGYYDAFGSSVALEGERLAVGAPRAGGDGAVYVFERTGASWFELARLSESNPPIGPELGRSVALDGDLLAVGASSSTASSPPGRVLLFSGSGASWAQVATLAGSESANYDQFGWDVDLDGDWLVATAPSHDGGATESGAGYAFLRSGSDWNQVVVMVPSAAQFEHGLGEAAALEAGTVLLGAPGDEYGWGAAFRYQLPDGGCSACTAYCTAGTSSSGCLPTLSALGTPSASASSGFWILAVDVEGGRDGLFYYGANGRQAVPWGGGTSYQCVLPPVVRAGPMQVTGTQGACDGGFLQDLATLWTTVPPKNPGTGAVVQAQLWYRDPPNTAVASGSLSAALEFALGP